MTEADDLPIGRAELPNPSEMLCSTRVEGLQGGHRDVAVAWRVPAGDPQSKPQAPNAVTTKRAGTRLRRRPTQQEGAMLDWRQLGLTKRLAQVSRGQTLPASRPPFTQTLPRSRQQDGNSKALERVIECEIIPRLMLAHREAASLALDPSPARMPDSEDVVELTARVLRDDTLAALALVEALRVDGVPLDQLLLELLAPAARHLGDLWSADMCDFTDVTLGTWRLQTIMNELASRAAQQDDGTQTPLVPTGRILLATTPGEQHAFGTAMLAVLLRFDGWEVVEQHNQSCEALAALAKSQPFNALGLSLSSELRFDALKDTIRQVRAASHNRDLVVMVGGRVFAEQPGLIVQADADWAPRDARDAIQILRRVRLGRSVAIPLHL